MTSIDEYMNAAYDSVYKNKIKNKIMLNTELKNFLLKKPAYFNTAFTLLLDKMCGYQRARYQNLALDANITGLSLLLLDNRFEKELSIFLDFKDELTAQAFFTKYATANVADFVPSSFGALEDQAYQAYVKRPVSYVLSFSFELYGYDPKTSSDVKQNLQNIIAAVQDFDPMDTKNFQHLTENFYLDMQNLDQQKFIVPKKFYFEGGMMQFFAQKGLPRDLAPTMVNYLDDKTNRNISSLNHAIHEEAEDNLTRNFRLS